MHKYYFIIFIDFSFCFLTSSYLFTLQCYYLKYNFCLQFSNGFLNFNTHSLLLIYFTNNFTVLTVVFGTTTLYVGCLIASQILHDSMLKTILHAKMSFFNVTPLGRILNRISKDVDIIDITLPPILLSWNRCLIMVSALG